MPPTGGRTLEQGAFCMRKRVVKMALRLCALLALAGIMAVNAMAGDGPVPDPNGPGTTFTQ